MKRAVLMSIFDQGLISAFNLVLNLVFIAYATPTEFGRFAFVLATAFFAVSAQNALVVMPLNYLLPGRPRDEADRQLSMLTSVNLALAVVTIPVSLGLGLMLQADLMLTACVISYFLAVLIREYVRNYLVVTGQMYRTLIYDIGAIIASVVLTLLFWMVLASESAVLAGMTGGNLIALFCCRSVDLKTDFSRFSTHMKAYRAVWRDTRWALQGALQGEVVKRSYVFLVERMRDAAALGALNAGRVGLSPLMLIGGGWARIARPKFVEELRHGRTSGAAKTLWSGVAMITAASAFYGLALVVAWPLIETTVFRGRYPGIDTVVLGWWIYAVIVGVTTVPATLLEARRQFKELAAIGLAGAILIPILVFALLLARIDITGIVLALAGAHLLELFALLFFLTRKPAPIPDDAVLAGE